MREIVGCMYVSWGLTTVLLGSYELGMKLRCGAIDHGFDFFSRSCFICASDRKSGHACVNSL